MASFDHYEKYEWLGVFWTPDQSIQFSGKLTYSPENGVELEFLYPMTGGRAKKTNHIYGALVNGEPCTLYGSFNPDGFGFHAGKISIYKGRCRFWAALFGGNFPPEEKYDGVWLDLTNFQEFCYPQGFKDFAKYSPKPIQQVTSQDLTISIVNSGKFKFLGDSLENFFYCDNEKVMHEISSFFGDLKEKYPEDLVHARGDIGWIFEVRSSGGLTVEDVLVKQVHSAENLLSLLVYSPIRRKEISIMKKSHSSPGKFESLPLLTSLFDLDKFKIAVLQRKLSHMDLPITAKSSNFAELFAKWKDIEDGVRLFTGIISNRFGKSYQHQLYAEIVLVLTQLEAISYSLGAKAKEKYTLALCRYASKEIVNQMKAYFAVADNEKLGKALTDLRAEVAHVGKPSKHLKNLSGAALVGIARGIEIAIASHIYEGLGISANQIVGFQKLQAQSLPMIFTK